MAQRLRARVNESLQGAAGLLSLLESDLPELSMGAAQRRDLMLGSALYHLLRAYRALLAEILSGYQLAGFPHDAQEALALVAAQGRHSGELQGLRTLEADGWLGDMLACADRFGLEAPDRPAAVAGSLAIEVTDKDTQRRQIEDWLRRLQQIALDYSDLLDEW